VNVVVSCWIKLIGRLVYTPTKVISSCFYCLMEM